MGVLDRLILRDDQWERMSPHIIGDKCTRGSSGRDKFHTRLRTEKIRECSLLSFGHCRSPINWKLDLVPSLKDFLHGAASACSLIQFHQRIGWCRRICKERPLQGPRESLRRSHQARSPGRIRQFPRQ